MRISDSAAFDAIRKQALRARKDLAVAQEQAGTGMRVQKPSDDPVAAAAARREHSRKALADGGIKNAELATMQLEGADEALDGIYAALSEARELAVQGSSSSLGDENLRAAALQVRKIRDQMVSLGNTNVAGRYVFAGFRDQQPAFDASGNFVGDDSTKEVQTLPNLRVATSVTGNEVFGSGSSDDVFGTLDRLATALETGDIETVRGSLGTLEDSQERVLSARVRVGTMLNDVEMARSVADRYSFRSEIEIGRLTEVDEITAATALLKAKSALEAAIVVAQQIPVGGLVGGK